MQLRCNEGSSFHASVTKYATHIENNEEFRLGTYCCLGWLMLALPREMMGGLCKCAILPHEQMPLKWKRDPVYNTLPKEFLDWLAWCAAGGRSWKTVLPYINRELDSMGGNHMIFSTRAYVGMIDFLQDYRFNPIPQELQRVFEHPKFGKAQKEIAEYVKEHGHKPFFITLS